MTKSKQLRLVALAFAAAMALAIASPVHAQATGDTDIDINIPDIVFLHYYGNVDVTITAVDFANYITGGGPLAIDEGIATPAAGGFTQDLAIAPSVPPGNPGAAVLTLQNAWAVRSMSLLGGTDTRLTISITNNTLTRVGGGTILITGVAVDDGGGAANPITWAAQGLGNPRVGDVQLTLDMSNAIAAGDYLDGIFTLLAENI